MKFKGYLHALSILDTIYFITKDKMKLGNGTSEDIPTHRNNESQTDRTISNNAKGSSSFEIDTEDNPTESRAGK